MSDRIFFVIDLPVKVIETPCRDSLRHPKRWSKKIDVEGEVIAQYGGVVQGTVRMEKYLFWGVFFFAYLVNGITGFAGNIFAMPVGMYTIGLDTSVAVLNWTGFIASVVIAFTSIKHVVWREVLKMTSVMLVFMVLGAWLDHVAPLEVLSKVYGAAVLIIAIRSAFFKKHKLLPEWALWIILACAGVIQGMFVSGGSFLAIYALQKFQDKNTFRATTTMTWVFLNCVYGLYGIQSGSLNGDGLLILAVCIPMLLLATWLGSRVQDKISQDTFMKFTYGLLMVIGVVLLIK